MCARIYMCINTTVYASMLARARVYLACRSNKKVIYIVVTAPWDRTMRFTLNPKVELSFQHQLDLSGKYSDKLHPLSDDWSFMDIHHCLFSNTQIYS